MTILSHDRQPFVSIIIPLYNSEQFIEETLNSCINQTYNNFEIIVVNDESTDNSLAIVQQYAKTHSAIKVFHQDNAGACRARNLAFEKSRGAYLIYLDSDDIICEEYIEEMLKAVEGKGEDAIATGEWDRFHEKTTEATFPRLASYDNFSNSWELLLKMWSSGEMLACSSYLVPRRLVELSGGWDENVKKNQDGEFFSRILSRSVPICHTPKAKFYYRTGSYDSVSKASNKSKVCSLLDTFVCYRVLALAKENSERVRKALSVNFSLFMYIHGNQFPDLMQKAKEEVRQLGVGYQLNVEPPRVQLISKIIGFERFLWLRKHFLHR